MLRILACVAACAAAALGSTPLAAQTPIQAEQRLGHASFQSVGTGSPVVLIPGLSTPRTVWESLVPELSKSHRLILVQVNGFAGDAAGANTDGEVLAGVVEDLHRYLAANKVASAPIVGHSMGGLIAMMLAKQHPEDVSKLMVVDALPFAGVMFDEKATPDSVRPLAAMLKNRMAAGYAGEAGDAAAAANAKALTAKPESAEMVKSWVLRADPKVAAEAMAEDLVTDMRGDVASIKAPLMVLHPATALGKDAAATEAFYKQQYAAALNAELIAIPDSGHFIMLDQPARFADEVRKFLP